MKPVPADELARRVRAFEAVCREQGLKITSQRLLVFSCLARSLQHPDAETVHREVSKKLPHISLDTVYRNLWLFVEMGVATVLSTSQGSRRFEADVSIHHHFVCRECGSITDVSHPPFDAMRIPTTLSRLGEVERACVELRGRCQACLSERSSARGKRVKRHEGKTASQAKKPEKAPKSSLARPGKAIRKKR